LWLLEILPDLLTDPTRHRKTSSSFFLPLYLTPSSLPSPSSRAGLAGQGTRQPELAVQARLRTAVGVARPPGGSVLELVWACAPELVGRSSLARARRLPSPTPILPANHSSSSSGQGEIRPRSLVKPTNHTPPPPHSRRPSLHHAPLYLCGHSAPDTITPPTGNRGEGGLPPHWI
jgi:hypothetical protein